MSNNNIKIYRIEFEAENVSPEQRAFYFKVLDKAFDSILEDELVGDDANISLGETRVSNTDAFGRPYPEHTYEEIQGLV
jgi:hypothetical protein